MRKIANSILFVLVFSLAQTTSTKAQVSNQSDVYANVTSCAAYDSFLAERSISDSEMGSCDAKTVFLVENDSAEISGFLRAYISKSQEGSTLYAFAEGLLSTVRSFTLPNENINSFYALGSVETQLYSAFSMGGDAERAVLYSLLLFDTKMRMLLPELRPDSHMADGISSKRVKVSEMLGEEFESFDFHSADSILICLIKTDNFRVSVLQILRSKKMENCLRGFS